MPDLPTRARTTAGLGTRCAEAQADGVPCPALCDCETCTGASPLFLVPPALDAPHPGPPAARRPHA